MFEEFQLELEFDLLSEKSLQKLEQSMERLPRLTQEALDVAIDRTIVGIKSRLMMEYDRYGLTHTDLPKSTIVERIRDGVYVNVGAEQAVFIEFGTGHVGKGAQHPMPGFGKVWIYDYNDHGESGWWYPSNENDPNPTRKLTKQGTYIAWTRGTEAKPFLYNTWRYARRAFPQFFNVELKRRLVKL